MSIDTLRAKLRQPYPQYSLEWRILIAVALILAFGVVASLWFSDWAHFARSGSLIVVVGIYVTWKDVIGKVDFAKRSLPSMIEKEKLKLGSGRGGLLTKARSQKIEGEIDELGEELAGLLKSLTYRVRTLEVGTIVFGTLVWGFGDLIGKLFT